MLSNFPNLAVFNQTFSVIKIFINITSSLVAIKNRFHIPTENIIFIKFGLVLCNFIAFSPIHEQACPDRKYNSDKMDC